MAFSCISRMPIPVPSSAAPHPRAPMTTVNYEQVTGFTTSFCSPCPSAPVSHPYVKTSSSAAPSFLAVFARRAFMSFSLSLVIGGQGQRQDAQALEDGDDVGLVNGQLRSCEGGTSCVSTSAFRSPSRFMPPWSYLNSRETAYTDLLKALERMGAKIVEKDNEKYIYATMTWPSDGDDVDDLEFLFVGDQVCYRSRSRKMVPDPPFCWWPGCINGPKNRGRMEALRDELGWLSMETDEEKVPSKSMFHAFEVPMRNGDQQILAYYIHKLYAGKQHAR